MKLPDLHKAIVTEFEKKSGYKVILGFDALKIYYNYATGDELPTLCLGAHDSSNNLVLYAPDNPNSNESDVYKLSALFHEIAHASGTEQHLNRNMFRNPWCDLEEVVAELTASKIMSYFDLSTDDLKKRHKRYIYSYNSLGFQMEACEKKAAEAVYYILSNWLPDFNKKRLLKDAV